MRTPRRRFTARRGSCLAATRRGARGQRGFGLILVLLVLAVSGGALAMMTAQSGAITYQTRRMTEDAWRRNLQASAAAWAARNPSADLAPGHVRWVELDAAALRVPGAKVTVGAGVPGANGVPVTVNCQFDSAGRTVRSAARCTLAAAATRPAAE